MKINKIVFLLNCFAFIYFILLIIIALNQWNWQPIQIIGELITIPLIAVVIASVFYAIVQLVRKTDLKYTMPILLLALMSLNVITIATMNQL